MNTKILDNKEQQLSLKFAIIAIRLIAYFNDIKIK